MPETVCNFSKLQCKFKLPFFIVQSAFQFHLVMFTFMAAFSISDSAGTTNACSSNNGGCPHLCLPKPGNQKTCACTTGFYLSPDGTRCEQYDSFAIVSTLKYIRGFHINSSDHSEAMVPVGGSMSVLIILHYAKECFAFYILLF